MTTSSECQCSSAGLRLFAKPDRPASRIFQQLFTGAPLVTRSLSRFSSPSAPGRGGAFPPRGRGGHTSYKKVVHTAAPMAMSSPPVQTRNNRHSYDIDAPSQAQSTPEFIPSMHYNPQGALGCAAPPLACVCPACKTQPKPAVDCSVMRDVLLSFVPLSQPWLLPIRAPPLRILVTRNAAAASPLPPLSLSHPSCDICPPFNLGTR